MACEGAAGEEDPSLLLLGKKKRKKKKPTEAVEDGSGGDDGDASRQRDDGDEAATATGSEEVGAATGSVATARETLGFAGQGASASDASSSSGHDLYSYGFLLNRLRDSLRSDHPSHPSLRTDDRQQRSHVPPPQLAKVGGRRVAVTNFGAIVSALRRDTAHVQAFILTELATTGSLDGAGESLTLAGILQAKHIEQLLRKYVHEYVICGQCKSLDTVPVRAEGGRESLLVCKCCNAERILSNIKAGFQAVRRGERRARRAQ